MSAKSANRFTRKKVKQMPDYKTLGKQSVAVGLPDDIIHGPSGLTLAKLGTVHEFGSTDKRVPERSFLRSMLNDRRADIKQILNGGAKKVSRGLDAKDQLDILASWAENAVKEQIVNVIYPKKAESTLKRNPNKTNPLIVTGEMRAGVVGKVVGND